VGHFLNFLFLLLFLFLAFISDIFNFVLALLLVFIFFLFILFLFLVITFSDFFFLGLFNLELDVEADKLAVALDDVLDLPLFELLQLFFLQEEHDLGASGEFRLLVVRGFGHHERTPGSRFPHEGLVIVVLGDHLHFVGDQISGLESHSELPNHGDVCA